MLNDLFDFGDSASESKYPREIPSNLLPLIEMHLLDAPSATPYDVYSSTYGSEYEIANIPRDVELPTGLTWDGKDQTVMNTNGIATDPSLDASVRTWNYGGEMNTKPCTSIDELVDLYRSLLEKFPEAAVNNSCNLHNHMRIPGLDLTGLKRLVSYYYVYHDEMVKWADYIPTVEEQGFTHMNTRPEWYKLAEDRYKHHTASSKGTRHGELEEYVLEFKLKADSEDVFHAASCFDKTGSQTRSWAIASRGGINTLQMRRSDKKEYANVPWFERPYAESGTIEFRMHHGTTDIVRYKNTLLWDTEIANAALNTGETPEQVFRKLFGTASPADIFPPYFVFEPEKYCIFKMTKNDGSNIRRDEVKAAIAQLKQEGKI